MIHLGQRMIEPDTENDLLDTENDPPDTENDLLDTENDPPDTENE